MVAVTRIVALAASIAASSSLMVSATPTLPPRPMTDPAQRAVIDKNIGCITGVCGFNQTERDAAIADALNKTSAASSSISGWSTPAVAAVAVGGILVSLFQ